MELRPFIPDPRSDLIDEQNSTDFQSRRNRKNRCGLFMLMVAGLSLAIGNHGPVN